MRRKTMTQPFDYSPVPLVRRHGPRGYADYASFRPWLRDEFSFRCVYCLTRERWGQGNALFALDHFLPVAPHPDRVTDDDNLVFACATCNANKGDRIAPDPLCVLLNPAVSVAADGTLHTDAEASRLIELLRLNDPRMVEFRMHWIAIVSLAARHAPGLYHRLMGYPDDLPDLRRLQPPAGNSRPEGVEHSAHARRERGGLPAVY
jgi:hypothetical protein